MPTLSTTPHPQSPPSSPPPQLLQATPPSAAEMAKRVHSYFLVFGVNHLYQSPTSLRTDQLPNLNKPMAGMYYSGCKRATEAVFDHSIDQTSEWRTFANESGDNDLVRVSGPSNPFHRRWLVDYFLKA
ncbi:hypothetical protein RHGRI_019281 [Rhododendron griersonianum]|uniref:Uncharacterized protein n=1 Tax=Rhododendron griersonianum TaxID=479676 RepID=A0AAV6JC13_9ERIC|nr:hypothetical protein RHGRI_019281 [Rhododendron griersonianum]